MTPNQPYLLRAFYEWIVDNKLTPHIVVDATIDGVDVPTEHVKDGQIILNISPSACGDLLIQNDWVTFKARFSGVARELFVPVTAVLAIFARENGAGTVFMEEESLAEEAGTPEEEVLHNPAETSESGSQTEIHSTQPQSAHVGSKSDDKGGISKEGISSDQHSHEDKPDTQSAKPTVQKLQSVSSTQNSHTKSTDGNDDDPSPTPPRPKGKPSLKVIK